MNSKILKILRLGMFHEFVFMWCVVVSVFTLVTFLWWLPHAHAEDTDSHIRVMNTEDIQTTIDTTFYTTAGADTTYPRNSSSINAKGTASIVLSEYLRLRAGHYAGRSIAAPNIATGVVYGPGANQDGTGLDAYPVESYPEEENYLPIVVRNLDGLNTMIQVMNTSESAQTVDIYFYRRDGALVSPTAYRNTLPGNATWSVNLSVDGSNIGMEDGFSGSAKISGTGTLSVVAQLYSDDESSAYLASSLAKNILYFPWVQRSTVDLTAKLYLQNIGSGVGTVACNFYQLDGSPSTQKYFAIPATGQMGMDLSTLDELPDGEYVVVASSDQPMVGVVLLQNSSDAMMCAYNPTTRTAANLYAPFVKVGDGWSTSIYITNLSAGSSSFNYGFRNPEGTVSESGVKDFPAFATVFFTPASGTFQGACTVESTDLISGVVLVKSPDGYGFCYPATSEQGIGKLFMPHLVKNTPAQDLPYTINPAIPLLLLDE